MSGELPIETLLVILLYDNYYLTHSTAFLGAYPYPKIHKFLVHICADKFAVQNCHLDY